MGVKVYQFDICEAIGEQDDCPGITTLKAGDHDLAPLRATVLAIRSLKRSTPVMHHTSSG
jgi:hypothetical protein